VIRLQITTVFWLDGGNIYQLLNTNGVKDVRQTELHTAEPLVSEPRAFEVQLATEKLKSHKSLGIEQIPAELIKVLGRTIRPETNKLIVSTWNKEQLPEEWKESIIVPISKKGDKTDCSNYTGISLLPTTFWRNKLPMFQVTS